MGIINNRDQEFTFGDKDFSRLQKLIYAKTGIVLKDHKKNMLYGRLARRLRVLGFNTFKIYINYIDSPEGIDEMNNLINAVTTNLTKFFRESHHFDHLKKVSLKEATQNIRDGKQDRIRIWSAGCSSGEEPYSIAMSMCDALPNVSKMDAKILATDLDTNMLTNGINGEYRYDAADTIPERYLKSYTETGGDEEIIMDDKLKNLISFKKLNLLENWPMKGPFDVIFCRNVMIYFDNETKANLMDEFATMLRVGGWIYIGHSESAMIQGSSFKLAGQTMYQKVK